MGLTGGFGETQVEVALGSDRHLFQVIEIQDPRPLRSAHQACPPQQQNPIGGENGDQSGLRTRLRDFEDLSIAIVDQQNPLVLP